MSVEILDLAALALTAVFFALLYYLHKKKHVDFGVRTILAVGLGLIVGLVFKGHHTYVAAVGTIYAHVVSAVVIPLLIFSIISSIADMARTATNVVRRYHPCGCHRRPAGQGCVQWRGRSTCCRGSLSTFQSAFETKPQAHEVK